MAQYARYTFLEAATQHGYVSALMAPRTEKSRHIQQIIIDPSRGRVYQLFRVSNTEVPIFEFVIPERLTTESTLMWRAKTKKALEGAWKQYEREREAKKAGTGVPSTGTGKGTKDGSDSTDWSLFASSTAAPPKPEPSTGGLPEAVSEARVFDHEPSIRVSSKTDETSSKG